jgi:glycosyltransferase involved in cell wall biosynthesis
MLVTGIIPVHNHVQWVDQAIRSFLDQDHPDKRLVVVDDGSMDGSFTEIVKHLTGRRQTEGTVPLTILGKRQGVEVLAIRFEEAHGPSFARNYAIDVGWDGTDYFALLDSDDFYQQGKVSRSLAEFARLEHLGVVYSDYSTLSPDGLLLRQYKWPYSRRALLQQCIVNCDSVVSRAVFEKVGKFDESLRVVEDYDLWLRASEHFLFSHLPEDLVTIRVGGHSSTDTVKSAVWQECYRRVFAKLQKAQ